MILRPQLSPLKQKHVPQTTKNLTAKHGKLLDDLHSAQHIKTDWITVR
jgi:hypothetical protein